MAYYDDNFEFDDYGEPRPSPEEQAQAAISLADEMRMEEEALTGPGLTYDPGPMAVSSPYRDPIAEYQQAEAMRDPLAMREAWAPYVHEVAATKGFIPMAQATEPVEVPSAAQQQFEAQQNYIREIERGVPQQSAFSKWGMLMFPPTTTTGRQTAAKPQPVWVPADEETGAPGHFETGTGTVHIPAAKRNTPEETLKSKQELADISVKTAREKYLWQELSKAQVQLAQARSDAGRASAQAAVDSLLRELRNLQAGGAIEPPTRSYGQEIQKGKYKLRPVLR